MDANSILKVTDCFHRLLPRLIPNPRVWLIGDGRSGTTWLLQLLNYDGYYKEVFEPFHPWFHEETAFLDTHLYVASDTSDPRLFPLASRVFEGRFESTRRRQFEGRKMPRDPKGLLVKDVFANLFVHSVWRRMRNVKVILLLRHPLAVAHSKYKKLHWHWVDDPMSLWNQTSLRRDFLSPYEDLFREVSEQKDFFASQVLIWSVINSVPLQQFSEEEIYPVVYEQIRKNPEREVRRLLRKIQGNIEPPEGFLPSSLVTRPCFVSSEVPSDGRYRDAAVWKDEIPESSIDRSMQILDRMGWRTRTFGGRLLVSSYLDI